MSVGLGFHSLAGPLKYVQRSPSPSSPAIANLFRSDLQARSDLPAPLLSPAYSFRFPHSPSWAASSSVPRSLVKLTGVQYADSCIWVCRSAPLHAAADLPAKLVEATDSLSIGMRSIFVGVPFQKECTHLQLRESPVHQQIVFAALAIELENVDHLGPDLFKKVHDPSLHPRRAVFEHHLRSKPLRAYVGLLSASTYRDRIKGNSPVKIVGCDRLSQQSDMFRNRLEGHDLRGRK